MPEEERLLKVWDNWAGGIGYTRDDPQNPGLYHAIGLIGGQNDLRPAMYKNSLNYTSITSDTDMIMGYYMEDIAYTDTGTGTYAGYGFPFLQNVTWNTGTGGTRKGNIFQINMTNASYGTLTAGYAKNCHFGKPAKYPQQGRWHFGGRDAGDANDIIVGLSNVATPSFTPGATDTGHPADILSLVGHQYVQYYSTSGVRLLKVDGGAGTAADWGSYFPLGKSGVVLDMFAMSNAVFLLTENGIYSFNKAGRTGVVSNDYNSYRSTFQKAHSAYWRGGIVFPNAGGLLYYRVGQEPIYIGPDARLKAGGNIVPAAATEFKMGVYHGVASLGDYLYTLYQPDPASAVGYVMCGYADNERNTITWTVLDQFAFKNVTSPRFSLMPYGLACSTVGRPESADRVNPVLLFSDADPGNTHLSYMILDPSGSPFRGRANTHRLNTSGDAWFPELFFPDKAHITRIVVHTRDMASGDEWQLSHISNSGADVDIGAPILASGRHTRNLSKEGIDSFMLHVNWTATSTSSRVAPTITRIELWGYD